MSDEQPQEEQLVYLSEVPTSELVEALALRCDALVLSFKPKTSGFPNYGLFGNRTLARGLSVELDMWCRKWWAMELYEGDRTTGGPEVLDT